ncbi:MAG: Rrf2 family transcriptional regulator [Oscillospiraceae bacterium]|jgi:Rrf2 family protein|nr:Rrf2 family transcriptional regulator [Oscillospiraceae bacterium]
MRISTRGRYGLRFMLVLAAEYEHGVISLREVAERESMPEKYLEQIVSYFIKAGLVDSLRGVRGGYHLARHPVDITVGDILRLTENVFPTAACGREGVHCGHSESCVLIEIVEDIRGAVDRVMDRLTLEELLGRFRQRSASLAV